VRSGPGEARTILLLHIISVKPSKQPLMVRTFLKVYMELGSYFFSARTNKRRFAADNDVGNGRTMLKQLEDDAGIVYRGEVFPIGHPRSARAIEGGWSRIDI